MQQDKDTTEVLRSRPDGPDLPLVDISTLDAGAEASARVARQLAQACQDVGFFLSPATACQNHYNPAWNS